METLVIIGIVIAIIVVGVLATQAVNAGKAGDQQGDQAIADEKARLGLSPNDSLPYASSTLPSYEVAPEDVTYVEAPAQEEAVFVEAKTEFVAPR